MLRYLPFLLVLALWIYAFIDCLNTPEEEVRHLPKVIWIIVVLLFGEVLVGPVAWLVAGRRRGPAVAAAGPGRSTAWVAPDDNTEFLTSLSQPSQPSQPSRTPPTSPEDAPPVRDSAPDEALLKDWEADLRRREAELRRREQREGGAAED
ncbi:PLD nuclease N-terminal domain-containing protein [Streptomyces sp. NPDC050560]|uniref:PLD nuclease N-terminal domain-containing protein n=1 Tax=Streptomyces sp. NPDC050560 TaxID=3365630 RepID=UPI00379DA64D